MPQILYLICQPCTLKTLSSHLHFLAGQTLEIMGRKTSMACLQTPLHGRQDVRDIQTWEASSWHKPPQEDNQGTFLPQEKWRTPRSSRASGLTPRTAAFHPAGQRRVADDTFSGPSTWSSPVVTTALWAGIEETLNGLFFQTAVSHSFLFRLVAQPVS